MKFNMINRSTINNINETKIDRLSNMSEKRIETNKSDLKEKSI